MPADKDHVRAGFCDTCGNRADADLGDKFDGYPGVTVCDPFAGGGTTAVVAQALGCHFVGAEVDPETYAIAQRRLERKAVPA